MTTQDIARLVESIGLPYAYGQFSEEDHPGGPPFICFTYATSNHFVADGVVYARIKTLTVELYTDEKDPVLERAVEAVLDAADLCYSSDEARIDSERMYQVTWTSDILIT